MKRGKKAKVLKSFSYIPKRKKALSELIAYVILISITLALSVLVFAWVKCYIPGSCSKVAGECPEGVALIVKDYDCGHAGGDFILNLTIQNKGLFSADGFLVKVNDRQSNIGVYTLKNNSGGKYGVRVAPGNNVNLSFSLSSANIEGNPDPDSLCSGFLCSLRLVEVQPFVNAKEGSGKLFCGKVSSQIVTCN